MRFLVLIFSLLTLAAVIFAIPILGSNDRAILAEIDMNMELSLFIIAVAGWMPMPTNGAVLFSKWVCEKRKINKDEFKDDIALRDFKIGYFLTLFLAICFVGFASLLFKIK